MAPPARLIPIQAGRQPPGLDSLLRPSSRAAAFAIREVPADLLEELHALMAVGPGMTDASATRLAFATSDAEKARLGAGLELADRAAALDAPACAVIAYDREFAEQMLAFAADDLPGRSGFDA